MSRVYLFLLFLIVIFFNGCSDKNITDGSNSATTTTVTNATSSTKISGKVIDGYVKNARLQIADLSGNLLPIVE